MKPFLYITFFLLSFSFTIIATTLTFDTVHSDLDTLTDLTYGNTNKTVLVLELDSTNPNGFTLGISSLKTGNLVRYEGGYQTMSYPGNVASYTFSMAPVTVGQGTLGMTAPTYPSNVSLATPYTINFNTVPSANETIDYKLQFKMTVPANNALFSASFTDSLTFSITDL